MHRKSFNRKNRRAGNFKVRSPRAMSRNAKAEWDAYAERIDASIGIVPIQSRDALIAAGLLKPSREKR